MLQLAGHALDALSIGGVETCIQLPGYDVAFDVGRCPPGAVQRKHVLFTHAHMDHLGGVAWHCATRALRGMDPPVYAVPRENVDAFQALFRAWRRLDHSGLRHELVPMGPGDALELPCGLSARAFRSVHRVPCQGYGLWSRRRKLRPEFQGLAGEEIRRLRQEQGVDVTMEVEVPELAFTGDTLIDVVEREEVVRNARLLVMEVTFVDDRVSVEQCREKGHIHLFELADRAELFQNEAILLTHFSARYRKRDIERALERYLPDVLRGRVTPLLTGHG